MDVRNLKSQSKPKQINNINCQTISCSKNLNLGETNQRGKTPWLEYCVEVAETSGSKKEFISVFAKNKGMASFLALRKSNFSGACVENIKEVS